MRLNESVKQRAHQQFERFLCQYWLLQIYIAQRGRLFQQLSEMISLVKTHHSNRVLSYLRLRHQKKVVPLAIERRNFRWVTARPVHIFKMAVSYRHSRTLFSALNYLPPFRMRACLFSTSSGPEIIQGGQIKPLSVDRAGLFQVYCSSHMLSINFVQANDATIYTNFINTSKQGTRCFGKFRSNISDPTLHYLL